MAGKSCLWSVPSLVLGFSVTLTAQQPVSLSATVTAATVHTARVTIHATQTPLRAVVEEIARQAGLRPVYDGDVFAPDTRITLHVTDLPASDALTMALRGTGIAVAISRTGHVAFRCERMPDSLATAMIGEILGTVTTGDDKRPVTGATVILDHDTRGVLTDERGAYRFSAVPLGGHAVTVRMVGYMKQTHSVTTQEGRATSINFMLVPSANVLDQVVVTGTIIPTELKAVPNAITVITGKDIEQRGITHIEQLFRGDVPGLFAQNSGSSASLDEVVMYSRGATALSSTSKGTSATSNGFFMYTNPIKTYVDGVEVADPRYLSQIDPKSIERIEILTGPQASTIYGSNALNGVMQIFTKRGTTNTPQLTLNLLSGWVENNFSNAHTPQHDYSGQLDGVENRLSYNAGTSWNYIGPWAPAKQTTRRSVFGGTRLDLPTSGGRITANVTLRRSMTQNRQHGSTEQTITQYRETGWYRFSSSPGLSNPTTYTLNGQTLGLTLGYTPTRWWSHELGVGQDAEDTEQRYTARGYQFRGDTTLRLDQRHMDRRSLRYTTTVQIPATSLAQITVNLGADEWQTLTSEMFIAPQTLTGGLTGETGISRQPDHNTGGFAQTQIGIKDQLFFTYGIRAEWNPAFGAKSEPNYAPRYGVAYTREFSAVTAKVRGSYGRSTRPPQSWAKLASPLGSHVIIDYGNHDAQLANPNLDPEYQQGGEGGVELYLGTRGSLVVTRYNQTFDGLIDQAIVDSLRSLAPNPTYYDAIDANGYGTIYQRQYLNIGSIRNQGWELQGTITTGPLTTKGTYSWTKSRVIGITPKYRALFSPSDYPQYQPGARFQFLPEHTWALGITYAHSQNTVAVNITGTGQIENLQNDFFFRNLFSIIRLQQNLLNTDAVGRYVNFNKSYAMADLTAAHRVSSYAEGVLQVQNLTNRYTNDLYASYAIIGRQTRLGLRLNMP